MKRFHFNDNWWTTEDKYVKFCMVIAHTHMHKFCTLLFCISIYNLCYPLYKVESIWLMTDLFNNTSSLMRSFLNFFYWVTLQSNTTSNIRTTFLEFLAYSINTIPITFYLVTADTECSFWSAAIITQSLYKTLQTQMEKEWGFINTYGLFSPEDNYIKCY